MDIDAADDGTTSLVVKVVEGRPGSEGLPREALLYASGALSSLHDSFHAPRFFGTTSLPGGLVGIWIEYVTSKPGPWSSATFAGVAEHLGGFTRSCPEPVNTAARMVPARNLCGRADLCEYSLALLEKHATDPLVRRVYPPAIARGLRRLWEARAPVMSALAQVPLAVCHGDAQRNNLLPQSLQVTIAIDWANLATGPVGLDAATLLHYALAYFHHDMDAAQALDRQIFDGYARGLGMNDDSDRRQIRLTYATQLALGLGLLEIGPVLRLLREPDRREPAEQFYRQPLDAILDRRAQLAEFLLDLGHKAQTLAAA